MNKSQRIYFDTGGTATNKYIKVKLEQNIDTLEFMSLDIYTKDVYQDFNSDYGVLVGRVIANGGVGVPNAKISIFIPLTDEDALDGNIASIYPYKTPRDKNVDGKRYNLLPRVSQFDVAKGDYSPKQPFGSFPTKPEIVTNQSFLDVYKKYYKYTTLTNNAGDYMIFGVPIGTQTVHLSVDITDIGEYSMNPASMVQNLGYSPNLFTNDKTRIKPSNDLDDLPNIETQEIAVNIIPFWGDTENFIIGITRQDFRIRSQLNGVFTIFGSVFTDGDNSTWGSDFDGYTSNDPRIGELYRIKSDANLNISLTSKRIGKVTEKIYYYPNTISDDEIPTADPTKKMVLLDPSEYSSYKRDGDFVFIINCNRSKVITDDNGNQVLISDSSTSGIFTEFVGFITLEITPDEVSLPPSLTIAQKGTTETTRFKLKFPQYAKRNESFEKYGSNSEVNTDKWRKQHHSFEIGKYYSLSKFHGTVWNDLNSDTANNNDGFISNDYINILNADPFWNTGVIAVRDFSGQNNNQYEFPANSQYFFGTNWLNLTIHFPQFSRLTAEYSQIRYMRVSTNFRRQLMGNTSSNDYYFNDNDQEIAAGDFNTKWYARSDLHWTDIIEVPIDDIRAMNDVPSKGFNNSNIIGYNLKGIYRNGEYEPTGWPSACPINGGKINGISSNNPDTTTYFYKGYNTANCIQYLFELGLVAE